MKFRRRRWWRTRFAIYIGIIVFVFAAFIERAFRTPSSSGPPAISSSSHAAAPLSDWHDKRNWRPNLSVGMTEAKVRQIFGEPEKVRVSNFLETWVYGSGEITFSDGTVYNWTEPDSRE